MPLSFKAVLYETEPGLVDLCSWACVAALTLVYVLTAIRNHLLQILEVRSFDERDEGCAEATHSLRPSHCESYACSNADCIVLQAGKKVLEGVGYQEDGDLVTRTRKNNN